MDFLGPWAILSAPFGIFAENSVLSQGDHSWVKEVALTERTLGYQQLGKFRIQKLTVEHWDLKGFLFRFEVTTNQLGELFEQLEMCGLARFK